MTKARRTAIVLAGLALLFAAAAIYRPDRPRLGDDVTHLVAERAWRKARTAAGFPLPGTPDLTRLPERLAEAGVALGAPAFMRIFKREFELEIWFQKDGRFERFATYPICRFSGQLGPKLKEGDRQSPEGFYTVDRSAMNPASRWHRSFNLGFPNAYDRTHGRTGSALMVHGGCSSIGCYAMTNAVMDEIWQIMVAAFDRGQPRIHVHVFPFRMSEAMLVSRVSDPASPLWADLKAGHDLFEAQQLVPEVAVCGARYRTFASRGVASAHQPIAAACDQAGRPLRAALERRSPRRVAVTQRR